MMTRKHSWQCLPGSGRTRGCYDGAYDRDDIYFVYPDDEGNRDTAAPLADQGKPYGAFTVYVLRDSVTGILYSIDFAEPPYVLVEIALADVDPDIYNGPFDWLEGTNGFRIYVANAALTTGLFSVVYCPSAPGAIQTTPTFAVVPPDVVVAILGCPDVEISDLDVDFTVTPPDGVTVTNYHWDFGDGDTDDTGTTTTVQHTYAVEGTYNVQITATIETGTLESPSCPIELVASDFVVDCPDTVIVDLGVDFTEPPPTLPGGATVTNYHWDFGDGNEQDTGVTNTVHHDYSGADLYEVNVTITASSGAVSESGPCQLIVGVPLFCVTDQVIAHDEFETEFCETPVHFLHDDFEA